MRTLGIDLAARPENTAVCELEWTERTAAVRGLTVGVTDDDLLNRMESVDCIAVDVPFGWPTRFVDTLVAHSRGELSAVGTTPDVQLRWRTTDRVVFERTGLRPLSVSTDKIGAAALRWARIENLIRSRTRAVVDRSGRGRFVEVYPAAALYEWDLPHRGYKGPKNRHRLEELLAALGGKATYLELGECKALLSNNDHAFDSLLCSLVGRATQLKLTNGPDSSSQQDASVEGWIHLPKPSSLSSLVGG